jgi:hypothetical protein
MYHDSKQLVQPIRVIYVVDCVKEAQLERESDAIGEFDVFFQFLLVLETL